MEVFSRVFFSLLGIAAVSFFRVPFLVKEGRFPLLCLGAVRFFSLFFRLFCCIVDYKGIPLPFSFLLERLALFPPLVHTVTHIYCVYAID